MQQDFSGHHPEDLEEYAARLESLHPDVYRHLMPYIIQAAEEIENPDDLTEEELDAIAYQAALDSGFLRQMPASHNEDSIIDMAKVLLLLALYNQFDNDPPHQPVMLPYVFPPYWHPGFYSYFFPWFIPHHRFRGRPRRRPHRRPGGRPGGGRPGGGRPGGGRPGGGMPGGRPR